MFKNFFVITSLFICVILFGACSQISDYSEDISAENSDSISTDNTYDTHDETAETTATHYPTDNATSAEPPLSEAELTMPVPTFLTEEQQMLYRRAVNVYSHVFSVSTRFVEYKETLDYQLGEYEHFETEYGWKRSISQGRYQNWDDFTRLVLSVFTEDFFNAKNTMAPNRLWYTEHNGKLSFVDADRGGPQYYNYNFEDEFELVSMSDNEIIFNIIGHYSYKYPKPYESFEERDARVAAGWEMTDKFTVRMVMTEFGWRFDEFCVPDIDERAEILYIILENPSQMASEHAETEFDFAFIIMDDSYLLTFNNHGDNQKTAEIPNTETELFVLFVDGNCLPYTPVKKHNDIMIPGEAFTAYWDSDDIPLDSLVSAGYTVDIVNMDSNPFLGYELNAVMIETRKNEPVYTVDEAGAIIYDEISRQYEDLITEIGSGGDITLTHTDDRLRDILTDAGEYSISQVKYIGDFGGYYMFMGSKFGYTVYFNKYTGEIFSDGNANTICHIYIRKGMYQLRNLYW